MSVIRLHALRSDHIRKISGDGESCNVGRHLRHAVARHCHYLPALHACRTVCLTSPQTVYVGLVLLGFLCVAVLFVAARYYGLKASIGWNAIADGADSASTGAPVQSRQLGFNDVEASTPSTGAHADSLAYECECRSLRRSKRKQHKAYLYLVFLVVSRGPRSWPEHMPQSVRCLAKADTAVPWRIMVSRRKLARLQPLRAPQNP
jgi:hypothetical protein